MTLPYQDCLPPALSDAQARALLRAPEGPSLKAVRDRYAVRLTRTWRDEQGEYHDSDSFSGSELLRIARLAHIAYEETLAHRRGTVDAESPS